MHWLLTLLQRCDLFMCHICSGGSFASNCNWILEQLSSIAWSDFFIHVSFVWHFYDTHYACISPWIGLRWESTTHQQFHGHDLTTKACQKCAKISLPDQHGRKTILQKIYKGCPNDETGNIIAWRIKVHGHWCVRTRLPETEHGSWLQLVKAWGLNGPE